MQTQRSKLVAQTAVLTALVGVGTVISVPMPPPLTTLNLGPLFIFVAAILAGPVTGFTAALIGSPVGLLWASSAGVAIVPPGYLGIFLLGIMVGRAPMGLIAGFLRRFNETIAMVLAEVYEVLSFFLMDWILFGLAVAFTITFTGTLFDFIYVPVAMAVLRAVRKILNIRYLA